MRGMVTSPHHLASEAGLRVLREGGTAIEATVAMAACLAVIYPHMTSIGGDGFWLVSRDGATPVAIDACGAAAGAATEELYASNGLSAIPWRGPLAANTVAGTISGWGEALRLNAECGGRLPLSRLVEDAVFHAEHGFAVTQSQEETVLEKLGELAMPRALPIRIWSTAPRRRRDRSCVCRRWRVRCGGSAKAAPMSSIPAPCRARSPLISPASARQCRTTISHAIAPRVARRSRLGVQMDADRTVRCVISARQAAEG